MLSIIISSYQPQFYSALEKNIAETIGIPYEIIKIDNPNLMGICEAYNKGASLSKYDYLLFVHEDVIFHTKEWGQKLINHLEKENVGVVGVAGSSYVPIAPSGWHLLDSKYHFFNYIQNSPQKNNARFLSTMKKNVEKVFAIDGVFLAIKKNVFDEFYFSKTLTGFHSYDLDFSLRVAKKYDNYIINDIVIEHFSYGSPNKDWLDNNMIIRKNLGAKFSINYDKKLEKDSFTIYLGEFFKFYDVSFFNIIKTLNFFPFNIRIIDYYDIFKCYLYYIKNAK